MQTLSLVRGFTVVTTCLVVVVGACSTSHSTISTKPASMPRTDSSASATRTKAWAPQVLPGSWNYLIKDSSVVSINNDTTARVEPIESRMIYTLSISDSNNILLFTGRIDSFSVNTRLSTKSAADTSKPLEFHGFTSKQGQLTRLSQLAPATCTGTANTPGSRIGELLIVLPTNPIRVGDTWSDTSAITTCHGKIPLTQTVVREYVLLDLSSCQRGGVKVRRVVSDTFNGSSAESVNHLSANGTGTGISLLCLDRNTGSLLISDGESRLDLTVTTMRGVFPFTQKTSTHIEAR